MEPYSGRVQRDLSERRFNKADASYCCTGGLNLGCPFLRTNKHLERVCALYRSKPKLALGNHYSRVEACRKDAEAPTVRNYVIHATKKVMASSPEEARNQFYRRPNEGITIDTVEEGSIVEHEGVY